VSQAASIWLSFVGINMAGWVLRHGVGEWTNECEGELKE